MKIKPVWNNLDKFITQLSKKEKKEQEKKDLLGCCQCGQTNVTLTKSSHDNNYYCIYCYYHKFKDQIIAYENYKQTIQNNGANK